MRVAILLAVVALCIVLCSGSITVNVHISDNNNNNAAHTADLNAPEQKSNFDMVSDKEINAPAAAPVTDELPIVGGALPPKINHGAKGVHYGIDVSHYDTITSYDAIVKQLRQMGEGADPFCFVKISEGSGNIDKTAPKHIIEFIKRGCLTGVYHFFHSSAGVDAQVNRIMGTLHGAKYVMLDAELDEPNAGPNALAVIRKLESHGIRPILYTMTSLAQKWGVKSWGVPTWIARYGPKRPIVSTDIWQYTETGKIAGVTGKVDLNKSLCSKQRFEEIFY